jgi:hypothetical protein
LEVRAHAHRKQIATDDGGELQHRVAQQIAGQRTGDQLIGQPAGGHHEDGQDQNLFGHLRSFALLSS